MAGRRKSSAPMVPPHDAGPPEKTRRELNKLDKLHRIRSAALDLFMTRDYDQTTIREVAARADVAFATVFVYAPTKRDLLFLTINDELDQAIEKAAAQISAEKGFSDNLIAIFKTLCNFFARHTSISRLVLREMNFYEEGPAAIRFQAGRKRLIETVLTAIHIATRKREIGAPDEPEVIADIIFAIWGMEIRRSVSRNKINPVKTIEHLRRQLAVLIIGLGQPTTSARRVGRPVQGNGSSIGQQAEPTKRERSKR